jgi:hypothetical protein
MSTELKPRPRGKPTQTERLLAWARAGHPLFQPDWFTTPPDGGAPVTAVRSKVSVLERRGFVFSHARRAGHSMWEYRLLSEPPDVRPRSAGEAEVEEQLDLPSPVSPRSAIDDDWDSER